MSFICFNKTGFIQTVNANLFHSLKWNAFQPNCLLSFICLNQTDFNPAVNCRKSDVNVIDRTLMSQMGRICYMSSWPLASIKLWIDERFIKFIADKIYVLNSSIQFNTFFILHRVMMCTKICIAFFILHWVMMCTIKCNPFFMLRKVVVCTIRLMMRHWTTF